MAKGVKVPRAKGRGKFLEVKDNKWHSYDTPEQAKALREGTYSNPEKSKSKGERTDRRKAMRKEAVRNAKVQKVMAKADPKLFKSPLEPDKMKRIERRSTSRAPGAGSAYSQGTKRALAAGAGKGLTRTFAVLSQAHKVVGVAARLVSPAPALAASVGYAVGSKIYAANQSSIQDYLDEKIRNRKSKRK